MATVTKYPKEVRPLAGAITKTAIVNGSGMELGDVVRFSASNTIVRARANTLANCTGKLGIVVAGSQQNTNGTLINGETATVVLLGPVHLGASVALDETILYVLGNAEGAIDNAGGTVTRHIGYAISDTILFFNDTNQTPSS